MCQTSPWTILRQARMIEVNDIPCHFSDLFSRSGRRGGMQRRDTAHTPGLSMNFRRSGEGFVRRVGKYLPGQTKTKKDRRHVHCVLQHSTWGCMGATIAKHSHVVVHRRWQLERLNLRVELVPQSR